MTTQHTPGPWRVEADGNIVDQDGCDVIASHADAEGHYLAATEENRRLIAAAPDLLAACESLMEAQRRADAGEHGGFGYYVDAVDLARAAIAKAKGETK